MWRGHSFEAVIARRRVGVDPFVGIAVDRLPPGSDFRNETSDSFFANCEDRFDAVLIDGLHECGQAYRDIVNAMNRLEPGGFVLVDDVLPTNECAAQPSWEMAETCAIQHGALWPGPWMGDVYRAIWLLVRAHPEFNVRTIAGGSDGPAQSLVWWRSPGASAKPVGEELLEQARRIEFFEEFRFGPPSWMCAADEKAVFAEFHRTRGHGSADPVGGPASAGG